MEPQSALVRADGGIELNAEAAVDLHFAAVVYPRHTENDLPFGFDQPLQNPVFLDGGVFFQNRLERGQHLVHGLQKFFFVRVFGFGLRINALGVFVG